MAPTSHRLQTTRPDTSGYNPLPPYSDHEESTFANNLLCPRYAENDPTSAPPSPASIESFDVLDSIPWRQSYISIDSGHKGTRLRRQWAKYQTRIFAVLLLLVLLVTGCAVSTYLALAHYQSKTKI